VGRQLKEPFELMGYRFAAGTSLFPSIYLTHQRSDIYPEPKKFIPERFIERQFSPYEFLPFGGGNRRCLGYAFALFEMKLVLTTILSQNKLELLDNRPLKSVRRGITFTPAGGVRMKVLSAMN
jgi:cytochrome P450